MALISKRVSSVKPSPTIAVTTKARALRAAGKDVIGLGAGEPDFDTPENVKEAAIRAIHEGFTKYTAVDGISKLKEAIVKKFKNDNNIAYDLDQITVGSGAKQVIYNAFMSSLDADDEVIIPSPYWVSYPDMVTLAGGKPVIIQTHEASSFCLEAEDLQKAITPKTKWIIINSPGNPTGAVYSKKQLELLASVLRDYPNIYVLSDDIYEHIIYDSRAFFTFAQVAPDLRDRVLTLNGVSKSHAMTGWRIGYAGGPRALIRSISIIQSQSTSNPSSISQKAALEALSMDIKRLHKRVEAFQKRRDFVVNALNNTSGLSCQTPSGAFYVFPSCQSLIGRKTPDGLVIKNATDFATYLLESALVAVVPGIAFGSEGYFRISYATSDEALAEACSRIKKACSCLTPSA